MIHSINKKENRNKNKSKKEKNKKNSMIFMREIIGVKKVQKICQKEIGEFLEKIIIS